MSSSDSRFNDYFMQLALDEAEKALTSDEIPVGCIIVKRSQQKVISRSHNLVEYYNNPLMHAEILAIKKACSYLGSKALPDCDIYITLEPCTMCASAIAYSRLGRVYYGASDIKQGAIEHGVKFFTSKTCFYRPEIYIGIGREKSTLMLQLFFQQLRQKKKREKEVL